MVFTTTTGNQERLKSDNKNNPVIIIGGGASGLSAAKRLKENGVSIVVLEGRDRLGGRIHTVEVTEAQPSTVDMGAAWIDGVPSNYVYDVAVEAGLETVAQEYVALTTRYFNENDDVGWMPWYRIIFMYGEMFLRLIRFYITQFPDGTSIEEALDYWDKSSTSRKFFDMLLEIGGASRTKDQDANSLKTATGYSGSSQMIYGGYGKLISYLGGALSDEEVLMNKTVTNITVTTDEFNTTVVVETSEGISYVGSHVIVTVPLGVLKTDMITFDPPLPQEKLDAINRTGWGVVERIVLTFENNFWRNFPKLHSNIFYIADHSPARVPIFIDMTETAGSPTLAALLIDEIAGELSSNPDNLIEEVKGILITMFPDTYETPVAVSNSSWLKDPFARGSYAFKSPDFLDGDFELIAAPIHDERVLFAGDSTHSEFAAYVGGAMLSGLREANRILDGIS